MTQQALQRGAQHTQHIAHRQRIEAIVQIPLAERPLAIIEYFDVGCASAFRLILPQYCNGCHQSLLLLAEAVLVEVLDWVGGEVRGTTLWVINYN